VASTNGHVYIIGGADACVESIDIGEPMCELITCIVMPNSNHCISTGGILADDVTGTGEGKLEVIVVTQNGSLVCIGTDIDYDPIWTYSGKNRDARMAISRATAGVSVRIVPVGHETLRGRREVSGDTFQLAIEIVDRRPAVKDKSGLIARTDSYDVKVRSIAIHGCLSPC